VPIALKSDSLDLLEPYGPAQVCNGIDLPYLYLFYKLLRAMFNEHNTRAANVCRRPE
jgi:hypothetical protein